MPENVKKTPKLISIIKRLFYIIVFIKLFSYANYRQKTDSDGFQAKNAGSGTDSTATPGGRVPAVRYTGQRACTSKRLPACPGALACPLSPPPCSQVSQPSEVGAGAAAL
ncbi:MAG: hypothetical protein H7842_06745 [Gammaproteobacteria bacterium SHHR-1]